jgi:hypothetical protein
MGNHFEITAVGFTEKWSHEKIDLAVREIQRIESLLTTYHPDSETNLIDGYGYSSSNFKDWNMCDPNKVVSFKKPQLQQVQSTNSKNNSKPAPLKENGKILKIKGIALGDDPSVCPDIKTEKQTSERRYINTCLINEGDENYTIVFFDWSKSYVVRIFRVIYINYNTKHQILFFSSKGIS